jgi:MFS family permease
MARSILSVIAGYLIFALTAGTLFQLSGQPPHQPAPLWFMLVATLYGAAFALLGGYVAARLGRRRPKDHAYAVAGLVALGAVVSLLSTLGKGAIWTQVSALVLMAPCAALGGVFRARQLRRST